MKKFAFMAVASVLAMSAPATAAQFLITYTGTVNNGFDGYDDFGLGINLSRSSYVAKFILDTAVNASVTSDSMQRLAFGGRGTVFGSPQISAEFTLNNRSVFINGNPYSQIRYNNNDTRLQGSPDVIRHGINDDSTTSQFITDLGLSFQTIDFDMNLLDNTDYTQSFYFNASDTQYANITPDQRFGRFVYVQRVVDTNRSTHSVDANLFMSTITVAPLYAVAAVPEPATWAMMIAGFGIVGGAMRKTNRRRRSNVRVTYA